ncbi:MAG: hypothetical protein QNJ68_20025 [Microcoleaceae cyanobacterium MO_207.B10]|nr:hypothetical protein [Microcoleaceae cyanobacterium MO_207.B10]
MHKLTSITISSLIIITGGLSACGNRAKMETCKFIEIEDAEAEVDFGDVDIEGGEVEMVCGEKIVDVPWKEFRQKLKIDPGRYKNNIRSFEQQVSCLKNDSSGEKKVFCSKAGNTGDFVGLNFSYDD